MVYRYRQNTHTLKIIKNKTIIDEREAAIEQSLRNAPAGGCELMDGRVWSYYHSLKFFFNFPRDKKHVDWVKAYLSIWTELQAYIKEFHTTSLAWSKTVSWFSSFLFLSRITFELLILMFPLAKC